MKRNCEFAMHPVQKLLSTNAEMLTLSMHPVQKMLSTSSEMVNLSLHPVQECLMFVNHCRNGDFVQASSAVQLTNNAGMLGWSKHPVQKQFSTRNVDLVYASSAQMIVSKCRISDLVPASSAEIVESLSVVNSAEMVTLSWAFSAEMIARQYRNGDFVLGIQTKMIDRQCRNGDFVLGIQSKSYCQALHKW